MSTKTLIIVGNIRILWHTYRFVVDRFIAQEYLVIVIATTHDAQCLKDFERCGCQIIFLPIHINWSPWFIFSTIRRLISVYRAFTPQLVLHYGYFISMLGGYAARWLNISAIPIFGDLDEHFFTRIQNHWYARRLLVNAYSTAEEYWVFNRSDAEDCYSKGLFFHAKIRTLPGACHFFPPDEIPTLRSECVFRFLMISPLRSKYGVTQYLQAVKLLCSEFPQVEFHFAWWPEGEDSTEEKRILTCCKQNSDVILRKLDSMQDAVGLMKYCHAFIYPCTRESMPYLLLRAAATELPIITTYAVGCADMVLWKKTGSLCAVRDSIDLALDMKNIFLCNAFKRREMGRAGRKYVHDLYAPESVLPLYDLALQKWLGMSHMSMVRPAGIEPTTSGFGGQRSIH